MNPDDIALKQIMPSTNLPWGTYNYTCYLNIKRNSTYKAQRLKVIKKPFTET